jgi:Spy/CpxP family protein refolding chaperone
MVIKRIFRFAFPVLAVTAGALLLSGCRGRHCGWNSSPEQKADKIVKRIAKELDLRPEQKTKLDKIKTDILARKADFQAVHAGFRELALGQIRAATVDTAKLNQGLEEREAKIRDLRGFLVAEFTEFHDVLDSAQREKLASKLERHCR